MKKSLIAIIYALLCLWVSSAFAQVATKVPVAESDPYRMVYALLMVLAAIGGVAWLLKKMNQTKLGGVSAVRVVGGVNVGSRERVMVVEVAGRWIVVGVAPGQVTALAEMPQPPDDADYFLPPDESVAGAAQTSFMAIIKQKLRKSSN